MPPDPYQPPKVEPRAPPVLVAGQASKGARIAGYLFMVNGLVGLVDRLVMAKSSTEGMRVVLPTIIDFLIGVSLASGKDKYLTWAIVRVALGAVLFSGIALAQGNYVMVPFQLVLSGSFLALLIGNADKTRIIFGCVGFGLYVLLELVGFFFV